MTSKQSPRRARTMPEAIAMLVDDHRKVEMLFKRYEKADEAEKRRICELACKMLKAHTRLEEELFYPAAAEALDDADLITEAQIEHRVAKRLIEDLEKGESRDAGFKVLSEVVMHHVEEEQDELFPKLRKSELDFDTLAMRMRSRKQEIESRLGLAPDSVVLPAPSRRASTTVKRAKARPARGKRGAARSDARGRRRAA